MLTLREWIADVITGKIDGAALRGNAVSPATLAEHAPLAQACRALCEDTRSIIFADEAEDRIAPPASLVVPPL